MFFATAAEQRDKILIVDIHNLKEHQDELLSIEFQLQQQHTEKHCNLKIWQLLTLTKQNLVKDWIKNLKGRRHVLRLLPEIVTIKQNVFM